MRFKIITLLIAINISIFFPSPALAAYIQSKYLITNNSDAVTKCSQTCVNDTDWTGNWFTTSGQISVCECFIGWPYCPVINSPGSSGSCSYMR